jgi:hypothetical protein
MNKVIILIISHKPELNYYEQISLKQCFKLLGNYPIKLICPEGLDISFYKTILPDPKFDFIDPSWQSTYENFNRLKIEPFLYERYSKYKFILFYEPDAFIFQDRLHYWCDLGYDFIGAPWFDGFSEADENSTIIGIGNGGFSLRNTENALRTLKQLKQLELLDYSSDSVQIVNFLKILFLWSKTRNQVAEYVKSFKGNEDLFWTVKSGEQIKKIRNRNSLSRIYQKYFINEFNIAPIYKGIEFSFEQHPRRLFELNNYRLPFGCHAWWRYDLDFWKPHIEKFGYRIPQKIINE